VAVRWRHDPTGNCVLFVGPHPAAEVLPLRGTRPGFRSKLNLGTGLVAGTHPTRAVAIRHVEQAADAHYRAKLTTMAREALEGAGL